MKHNSHSALVPKQFLSAPFFASRPQKTPRAVKIGDERWIIGSEHALSVYTDKAKAVSKHFPALDIRHGKLIFLLMSKFRTVLYDWHAEVHFSMYELCNDYYGIIDGPHYKMLAELLLDLEYTKLQVFDKKNEFVQFSIINQPSYRGKFRKKDAQQAEFWLENVSFNDNFSKYLLNLANWLSIRLDELFRMPTPLSAACYTYLPSRAWHAIASKPFEITLSNLLEQIGEKVPAKKSLRKHKFYRKDKRYNLDVVADLDGAEINGERILRCEIAETVDNSDFKLRLWSESVKRLPTMPKGELWDAWRSGGGTAAEWSRRMSGYSKVYWDSYELDAFEEIPDWSHSERFYKMAKCLLGSGFTEELGCVKNAVREGAMINETSLKNPGAYLSYHIIRSVARENSTR